LDTESGHHQRCLARQHQPNHERRLGESKAAAAGLIPASRWPVPSQDQAVSRRNP